MKVYIVAVEDVLLVQLYSNQVIASKEISRTKCCKQTFLSIVSGTTSHSNSVVALRQCM